MEGLLILILLFIIFGIPLIGYALYIVPKMLGYSKIGKGLLILYICGIFFLLFMLFYEDELFFKNDARKLLKKANIELVDNFEILDNQKMHGIGDYHHEFTLEISQNDKERIIYNIKNAKNFTEDSATIQYLGYERLPHKVTQNYEREDKYVTELYLPQENHAPLYIIISIDKKTNELKFEDMLD